MTHTSKADLKLSTAQFAVLMYLRIRELEGRGPATREELMLHLEAGERTIDGVLAALKKHNLIERQVSFKPTPEGKDFAM